MTLTRSGAEIAAYFALAAAADERTILREDGSPLVPRFNIAPSQSILTIVPDGEGGRRVSWKRWGLVPAWARDPGIGAKLINARAETVASKPSFRGAFRRHRCLIAADGFYEWTPRSQGRRPFHFTARAEPLLAFAGLHEVWRPEAGGEADRIESCTVITTEASEDVAPVHSRMPVLLAPSLFEAWLSAEASREALEAMLVPAAPGTLARRAVSRSVNDPRRDDPGCLADPEPPAPEQTPLFAASEDPTA